MLFRYLTGGSDLSAAVARLVRRCGTERPERVATGRDPVLEDDKNLDRGDRRSANRRFDDLVPPSTSVPGPAAFGQTFAVSSEMIASVWGGLAPK